MKEFKECSICGKKIGWFRRRWAKRLDKDPVHLIPLSQFCSDKCAGIGLKALLNDIEKKEKGK
jgi:endogenous inhibitor of DNA gyrase (YacG/DUF329 family)